MTMQPVTMNALTRAAMSGKPQHAANSERSAMVVNEVFKRLKAIFPAWRQAMPDDQAEQQTKRQWTIAFVEAGLSSLQQIQMGLTLARKQQTDWWPSPGKFIGWCQPTPEQFGLPSEASAFSMACRQFVDDDLPDAVRIARENCEPYSWLLMPEVKARNVFSYHYGVVVRRIMNGEDVHAEVPAALPAKPESRPCEPAVAKHHIARIKAMLGRKAA